MDGKIVRTVEEIDEQLRRGEAFIKRHPESVFGDDNKKEFRITKDVLNAAKKGDSLVSIELSIESYDDEDEYWTATTTVEWLTYKNAEELYYEV